LSVANLSVAVPATAFSYVLETVLAKYNSERIYRVAALGGASLVGCGVLAGLRSRIVITISPSPIAHGALVPCFQNAEGEQHLKGFLAPAQYDKRARGCAKYALWMRTAFELAYTYGWRHGELLGLRVGQSQLLIGPSG